MRICFCDDEASTRSQFERMAAAWAEQRGEAAELQLYNSAEQLLFEVGQPEAQELVFDLILLDIQMGGMDGITLARQLRAQDKRVTLAFLTAAREYVFEGYDVGAFHYLLKPVDEQKFMEVMDKAISQIKKEKNTQPLIIRMDGNYIKIPVNNIIYAENEARKIVLHTKNMKEETYSFYEKMEVLEQKLGDHFFRSHRGFLVNLQEVVRYDNANIELKNGDRVFLAKQKYNDFVTAYMNYLRKA